MRASRADLVSLLDFLRHRPRSVTVPDLTSALMMYGDIQEAIDSLRPARALFEEESHSGIEADLEAWLTAGVQVTTILDSTYPRALRDIHEAPPVIFTRGRLMPVDRGVSVVGSRDASEDGLKVADDVSRSLVRNGYSVIAGLALGIDTQAHKAALAERGRTIAVIGTGILGSYPATNRSLQAQVSEEGLLVSQFWPDAPPRPQHFPIRNATMSGMGIATFVAEAGEKSGARIQARLAVQHGRPVILSNLVYGANKWAQELKGRPRVWIASNADEVLEILAEIEGAENDIEELLSGVRDLIHT